MRPAMSSAARALAAALALLVALPVTALAQPAAPNPGDASRAKRAQAEQLFRAGEQLFVKEKYDRAAEAFDDAYGTLPLPAIAFSAAQAYRLQFFEDDDAFKLVRAIELYEIYLRDVGEGGRAAEAKRYLAELRFRRTELEKQQRGPVGAAPAPVSVTRLFVTSQVEGAMVSVDGSAPLPAPYSEPVTPGKHRVVVTADGYFPFDETRDALEGESIPVEVELRERPALVTVRADAGAQISLDGRAVGVAPLARPLEVAAGKHLVAVTRRGHEPWTREITVARGEAIALAPDLGTTMQRKLAYGVFGVSAATLLASGTVGFFAIRAGGDAAELRDLREERALTADELARYEDRVAAYDARRAAAGILLGVGGGLAITGALLYLLDTPSVEMDVAPRGQALGVRPLLDGDLAGLAVGGSF